MTTNALSGWRAALAQAYDDMKNGPVGSIERREAARTYRALIEENHAPVDRLAFFSALLRKHADDPGIACVMRCGFLTAAGDLPLLKQKEVLGRELAHWPEDSVMHRSCRAALNDASLALTLSRFNRVVAPING